MARSTIWQELFLPRPASEPAAAALLSRLAADRSRSGIVFEARAEAGHVRYLVGTDAPTARSIRTITEHLLPGTRLLDVAKDRVEIDRCRALRASRRAFPLNVKDVLAALPSILTALASADRPTEAAVVQVTLGSAVGPQLVPAKVSDPTLGLLDLLLTGSRPASPDVRTALRDKAARPRFHAAVRLGAAADTEPRRTSIMRGILAAIRTLDASGLRLDSVRERDDAIDEAAVPLRLPLRLTPEEVLPLLAWPLAETDLPGLPPISPRLLPPPRLYEPPKSRSFGETTAPGASLPLAIDIADALTHTHVIGPTGTGKSTLLLHLIREDIQAGRSVVVIDPKRDLVMDVLQQIPERRMRDVVVIDPTQPQPVGVNPLRASAESAPLVADNVVAVFRGLFPNAFGPRTSDIVHASVLTLALAPAATLADLPRLLTDVGVRRRLVESRAGADDLQAFWRQYEGLSTGQQSQMVGPVLSRLRQFLLRPALKRVLDQPEPRFDLSELFVKPRIVLLPLNKGVLGSQSASLLGSLVVSQLWQLVLARAAIARGDRRIVSVYLDEAQSFLHLDADLGEALEQSRSLGVAWHIAHQFRDQMPRELMASIDANARSKIVFGLDHGDAQATAKRAGPPLEADDFVRLPPHHVYVSLMNGGRSTGWFSGRTLPPPRAISDPDDVLEESAARYGNPPATDTTPPEPEATVPTDSVPAEQIGRRRRGQT